MVSEHNLIFHQSQFWTYGCQATKCALNVNLQTICLCLMGIAVCDICHQIWPVAEKIFRKWHLETSSSVWELHEWLSAYIKLGARRTSCNLDCSGKHYGWGKSSDQRRFLQIGCKVGPSMTVSAVDLLILAKLVGNVS